MVCAFICKITLQCFYFSVLDEMLSLLNCHYNCFITKLFIVLVPILECFPCNAFIAVLVWRCFIFSSFFDTAFGSVLCCNFSRGTVLLFLKLGFSRSAVVVLLRYCLRSDSDSAFVTLLMQHCF